jgi:phosphatidylinositol alpha-1,6-mannosyltransferase
MTEGAADAAAAAAPPASPGRGERRPRLLVITPDFPPALGGIQLTVHRIVSGLTRLDPHVVTLDGPGAREFDARAALDVRRVPAPPGPAAAGNVVLNAAAIATAVRIRPELLLNAHIVTSPAAALLAAATGAPLTQCYYAKEIGHRPRLAAFAARRADAIISISSYTSGLLHELGVPDDGRIRLISPGVDLPSDPRPERSERPTVLTIARLADRYKGHDVMVQAIAIAREQVPAIEWVVVGEGPLRGELEALARARGVADHVRWLGGVSDAERDRWLRRTDVLAMPSRLPGGGRAGEGYGIVYLEASAYGKPVVAGNVAGAVDAVLDGETGLLVDPADPRAVAGAITRLLLDRELAARLGAAGARRADELAWPHTVARVEELLLETLPGSRDAARGAGADVSSRGLA